MQKKLRDLSEHAVIEVCPIESDSNKALGLEMWVHGCERALLSQKI